MNAAITILLVVSLGFLAYTPSAAATCILGLWTRDAVYLASDSKNIHIQGHSQTPTLVCKIVSTRRVAYTMSGVVNWETFHALDVAERSIPTGQNIQEIAEAFAAAATEPLRVAMIDMSRTNPIEFKRNLKNPLSVMFASSEAGEPKLAAVQFALSTTESEIALRHVVEVFSSINVSGPYG